MARTGFGVGIVGAGFIAREAHVPSFDHLPGAHVAAIQNRTREHAVELAEDCRDADRGDPTVYGDGDVAALVEDSDVDGLWVTTPNFTRVNVVDAAVDAIENGANLGGIALEKPVARTLGEALRIVARVEAADIPHAYLENWPYEPDLAKLRDLLWERGRDAGPPYIARSRAEHGGPHSAWFWDGEKQGGGALTDMLCHALAGNEVLLSDPTAEDARPEPLRVTADTETVKWARPDYAETLREEYDVDFAANPVDDYARATVRYEGADGMPVISEATGSWCYVGSGVRRSIELLGPEYSGQVVSDDDAASVFFSDDLAGGEGWAEKQTATSGRMPIVAGDVVTGGYVAENRDAIESFRRGENGSLDLRDGKRVLRLCAAAYKSAEEGEEIDLRTVDLDGYVPPPARGGR